MKNESTALAIVFDIEGTLARFGGDRQLFTEVTSILLEDAPQRLLTVQRGVSAGDAETVERNAHALKGLLLNSGGVRASQAAQALEDAAHARDLGDADRLMRTLAAELDALTKVIRANR